jgi:uncharacterized protein
LAASENGKLSIFISEEIVAEISQVLAYPKIEKVYKAKMRRQELMEQVLKNASFVQAITKVKIIKEHPSDNKFLECALAAKANYVVSGDKHLLKVVCYKGIQVLSVSAFLASIE